MIFMYYADCHSHSKYSFDVGDEPTTQIDALCEAAIKAGMSELAVTDHYEVNGVVEWGERADPVSAAKDIEAAREKYSDRLRISLGIELGQAEEYPSHVYDLISSMKFDYVLGSIHNLPGRQDFCGYDYGKMDQESIERLFEASLRYLTMLCDFKQINTIAHITYMHRYVTEDGKDIDFKRHYASIGEFFRKMIQSGKSLEINTSTMRHGGDRTLPSFELVKYYRELGGEMVTCGSDTHGTKYVGAGIKRAYEMLKEAGFGYVTVFHEGKPVMMKID